VLVAADSVFNFRYIHTPAPQELAIVTESARLASIAIEHKSTQDALVTSETTFRTLFQTAPVGVVYQNADGRITDANPAAVAGTHLDGPALACRA